MIALQIARVMLWLCARSEHVDAIIGDLTEEHAGAHYWLISQAFRSAVPLLMSRWRRGELAGLIAAALVTILAPLRLADLLWAFVHSQVPLKTDVTWATGIWIANLLLAICGAAVLGYGARGLRSAVTLMILGLACAGLSVVLARGHAPRWYIAALMTATSITILFAFLMKGRRGVDAAGDGL